MSGDFRPEDTRQRRVKMYVNTVWHLFDVHFALSVTQSFVTDVTVPRTKSRTRLRSFQKDSKLFKVTKYFFQLYSCFQAYLSFQ